ncbi:hypothetical protein QQY66_46795 [Streptomyces sp. DG2A-72]|uniref:hypothetical protein n=1 Tax=Streptomyces sp. DG2A-72 TaxID=3051386 RepID=UPI00265BE783|nr:hypothetical protein [Streptomyces sp. DG2A-72]MDO0938865.1 hypothetical protein [Streptomyces sp. DG2A-72]
MTDLFVTKVPSLMAKSIAEYLFRDLMFFGRLGLPASGGSAALEPFLSTRASVTIKVLQVLERSIGLRFAPESKVAYCQVTGIDTALSGYTDDHGPLPSEVAMTLLGFWHVQAELGKPPIQALAAVRAFADEHDFPTAVDYLFDLNQSGYLGPGALHTLAEVFALGRATPEVLVQRAWCEVGRLRACADIDEWTGQMYASAPALHTLCALINAAGPGAGIAVRAASAQLEEIAADLPWIAASGEGIGILTVIGSVIVGASAGEQVAGPEWRERRFAERSAVPEEVYSGLLGSDGSWAPAARERWFQLSWRTVSAWMARCRPDEQVMTMRSSYFGIAAESIYPTADRPKLSSALAPTQRLLTKHRYDNALSIMRPLEEHYPYAAPLHSLMAIAYDNSGRHREALDKVIPAIVLMPGEAQFWNVGARIAYTNGCESDAIVMEAIARIIIE